MVIKEDNRFMNKEEFRAVFKDKLMNVMIEYDLYPNNIAERTGLFINTIYGYCNGKINPSAYAIYRIAKAIGCSFDDLMPSESDFE